MVTNALTNREFFVRIFLSLVDSRYFLYPFIFKSGGFKKLFNLISIPPFQSFNPVFTLRLNSKPSTQCSTDSSVCWVFHDIKLSSLLGSQRESPRRGEARGQKGKRKPIKPAIKISWLHAKVVLSLDCWFRYESSSNTRNLFGALTSKSCLIHMVDLNEWIPETILRITKITVLHFPMTFPFRFI